MARLIPLVKAWPRLQSSLVRRLLSLPPPSPRHPSQSPPLQISAEESAFVSSIWGLHQ